MVDNPRILIAGGGTGGHVYPAIAIADAVSEINPEAAIQFAGTADRIEWRAVPQAGYPIEAIKAAGLQRSRPWRNIAAPYHVMRGYWQSRALIKHFNPHVVVGTGGYVSAPVLFAAGRMKLPVLIQEQNALPGKTNRWLARYANEIHIAFPEAESRFPAGVCRLSGNPTRAELLNVDRATARAFYELPPDGNVLLMFGGSLGSAALNRAMESAHRVLLEDESTWIIWQTGRHYYERYRRSVGDHPRLRLLEYIDRMDFAYAAADLVLCRSGAITCSELQVTGSPAVLVPSPNVAEDHQTFNARSLADRDAAVMLPEKELDDALVKVTTELLGDVNRRKDLRYNMLLTAKTDASDAIAHRVLALAGFPENQEVPA